MHERTRNSTRRMHACLGSRENRDQVPQSRRSVSAGDAPCLRTPPSARAHTSQWLAHIYIYIDRHAMTSTSTTLPVPPCPATASPPRLHAAPWSPVRPPPPANPDVCATLRAFPCHRPRPRSLLRGTLTASMHVSGSV